MRFGEFKPGASKPIGEGKEKKVYVNPQNPERVIAEIKRLTEGEFKMDKPLEYSPSQLKGAFYLTKIAGLVLPKNIPEIHQAGESREGQQTVDSEYVEESPKDISDKEFVKVKEGLEKVGLKFLEEEHRDLSNYTKSKDGSVKYTETLMPWRVSKVGARHRVELSFDKRDLSKAISRLRESKDDPYRGAKEEAASYLERIEELYTEAVETYAALDQENLKDPEEGIKEIEARFSTFESVHDLPALSAIVDSKLALENPERIAAKADLLAVWAEMQKLQNETKVTPEQYAELNKKYKELSLKAIGIMRGPTVDHS